MCLPCDWHLTSAQQPQHSQKDLFAAWRLADNVLPPFMQQRADLSQYADVSTVCLAPEPTEEVDQYTGQ